MTRRQLTVHERVFIIKRYFSTGSYKNIQEEWSNSFSTATPTKSTMFALINKFNTTGSTADAPRSGRSISVTTEENRQLVQGAFSASPKNQLGEHRLNWKYPTDPFVGCYKLSA